MDTASTLTWTHHESDAGSSLANALAAAGAASWGSLAPEVGRGYVRSFLVATLFSAQGMGSRPPPVAGEDRHRVLGDLRASDYATAERLFGASTLARTPQLLLPRGRYSQTSITTTDGGLAEHAGLAETITTGAVPVVVVVLGVVAAAAAVIVLAERATELIDRQLVLNQEAQRLVATQAQALKMVEQHTQREDSAGHPVPWTPAELELFRALLKQQEALALKQERPLPKPFPGATKAIEAVGEGVKEGVEWLLPLAVVVGGALVVHAGSNSKG